MLTWKVWLNIFSVHNYVTLEYGPTCILGVGSISPCLEQCSVIENGLYLEIEIHPSIIQGQRASFQNG